MQDETKIMSYFNKTERGYFEELETRMGEMDFAGTDGDAAALPNLGELCKKYNQIKGTLELALKGIEKIPFIGKKVAKAVRFLMSVADFACSGSGGEELTSADEAVSNTGSEISLSLDQIAAFESLDTAINSTSNFGLMDSDMAALNFDKNAICAEYRKVRKFIKPVLDTISVFLPGAVIAAIKLLMAIADSICGGDN